MATDMTEYSFSKTGKKIKEFIEENSEISNVKNIYEIDDGYIRLNDRVLVINENKETYIVELSTPIDILKKYNNFYEYIKDSIKDKKDYEFTNFLSKLNDINPELFNSKEIKENLGNSSVEMFKNLSIKIMNNKVNIKKEYKYSEFEKNPELLKEFIKEYVKKYDDGYISDKTDRIIRYFIPSQILNNDKELFNCLKERIKEDFKEDIKKNFTKDSEKIKTEKEEDLNTLNSLNYSEENYNELIKFYSEYNNIKKEKIKLLLEEDIINSFIEDIQNKLNNSLDDISNQLNSIENVKLEVVKPSSNTNTSNDNNSNDVSDIKKRSNNHRQ